MNDEILTRRCIYCKENKPPEEFHWRNKKKKWRNSACKECSLRTASEWYEANKDRAKAYYESNKRRLNALSVESRRRNPERTNAVKRRHRKENPDYYRDEDLRQGYGITLEQYNAMLAAQGGVCKICGKAQEWARSEHLHVDHCHQTGVVRGLLCHRCNNGLGSFKDNQALLGRAISYLQETQGE